MFSQSFNYVMILDFNICFIFTSWNKMVIYFGKSRHTILQVIGIYPNYCLLRNHWIISKTLRWSFLKCMYCEYVVYFSLQMWDGALYVIMLWIVCCLFPFSEVSWSFYLSMLSISLQMCDGGFYVSMVSIVRCLYLICK